MKQPRQSAAQFARRYADMKACLLATEGSKVAAYRQQRAQGRAIDLEPDKRERHRVQAQQSKQQGAT